MTASLLTRFQGLQSHLDIAAGTVAIDLPRILMNATGLGMAGSECACIYRIPALVGEGNPHLHSFLVKQLISPAGSSDQAQLGNSLHCIQYQNWSHPPFLGDLQIFIDRKTAKLSNTFQPGSDRETQAVAYPKRQKQRPVQPGNCSLPWES